MRRIWAIVTVLAICGPAALFLDGWRQAVQAAQVTEVAGSWFVERTDSIGALSVTVTPNTSWLLSGIYARFADGSNSPIRVEKQAAGTLHDVALHTDHVPGDGHWAWVPPRALPLSSSDSVTITAPNLTASQARCTT